MQPRRDLTLILSFIIAVGPVSVDMYLPAFAQIAQDFHDQAAPQLSLAWYSAGFALGQIPYGPVSDWSGRRPALMAGLVVYTFASIGCALSPGPSSFYACRALAAFGGAASIVIPRTLVFDLQSGDSAARLLSSIFAGMMVAPMIAPALGGFILREAGWRTIFLVAAAYGAAGFVLLIRFVPETLPACSRLPIRFGPLAMRYAAILRERGFLTNALVGSFAMWALYAYLGGTPVVFMNQYGLSPQFFSWILVVAAIATMGLLRFNRWLVGRPGWGFTRAANLDLVVFLAGGVLLVPLVWWSAPWPLVLLALLACSAGFTCVQPNLQPGALREHQVRRGSAQALMSTLQYGGGAVATAVLGWLSDGTGRPMALLILLFALAALTAAWFRPRGGLISP